MSNPTELPDLDRLMEYCGVTVKIVSYGIDIKAMNGNSIYLTNDLLLELARRAQPEGEAPQAELPKVAAMLYAVLNDAYQGGIFVGEEEALASAALVAYNRYRSQPTATLSPLCGAQHAESDANWNSAINAVADELESKSNLTFISQFTALCEEFDRRGAALAAQSQGAQAAELCIGFVNNDQGVLVNVMQRHADGTTIVLHHGRVPAGDSFARFAVAAQQAAAPGTVHITPQEAAAAGIECGDTECGGCNAGEPWCIHSAPGTPEAPALTPLDYRAQGREEALAIILAEDPENPFEDHTNSVFGGEDYSTEWDEAALRDLLHIGDAKHDAFERAEAAYWEALGRSDEAKRELLFAQQAPFYKPLHEFLAKHEAWDLMGDLKRAAQLDGGQEGSES